MKRARETADEAREVGRKRRRGEDKCLRFDLNVRELWEALDILGASGVKVLAIEGVVDTIVEYARSLLPLFAQLPPKIGGERNLAHWRVADWFQAVLTSERHHIAGLALVGSTVQCANPMRHDATADAVVVVPPNPHLCRKHELWVGVVLPVVRPDGGFGADRTVFLENWPGAGDPSIHNEQWLQRPGEPDPSNIAPEEGYYAIHYVNLWHVPVIDVNPITKRQTIKLPPFKQGSSDRHPFPNAASSRDRVHHLHGEIDAHVLETRLLLQLSRLPHDWNRK
jgi:hypothetical protein